MYKRQNSIESKINRNKFIADVGSTQSWWEYYGQYKNGVDILVNEIEGHEPVNIISMPLLFMIRHCIEIGLKANIYSLQPVNPKIPALPATGGRLHSLEFLFGKLEEHLSIISSKGLIENDMAKTIKEYLKTLEPLKEKLHDLDSGSFSFRYPEDIKGKPIFQPDKKIDIAEILDVFYEIQPFLRFLENVLYERGVFGFEY